MHRSGELTSQITTSQGRPLHRPEGYPAGHPIGIAGVAEPKKDLSKP